MNNAVSLGIDKETKESYKVCLGKNMSILLAKLKKGSYRPQLVKRVYIPKAGSDKIRPLGILALEDKIVEGALVIILQSIYEEDFLPISFGFRPDKSCHDALKNLSNDIVMKKVNYIVDADIKAECTEEKWLTDVTELKYGNIKEAIIT